MEQSELVTALNDIEEAIYVVGFMVWISALGYMITLSHLFKRLREVKGIKAISFDLQKADNLYNAGNFDELLSYCNLYERSYPNDINIIWYQALIYYQTGDFNHANEKFSKAIEINPHYRESAEPYLEKIYEAFGENDKKSSH